VTSTIRGSTFLAVLLFRPANFCFFVLIAISQDYAARLFTPFTRHRKLRVISSTAFPMGKNKPSGRKVRRGRGKAKAFGSALRLPRSRWQASLASAASLPAPVTLLSRLRTSLYLAGTITVGINAAAVLAASSRRAPFWRVYYNKAPAQCNLTSRIINSSTLRLRVQRP